MTEKTGFIGLGTMGLPMANRLRQGGVEVLGWDVDKSALARFGAAAGGLAELAAECRTFITMLPEGEHVAAAQAALLDAGVAPGCLFIDCSTIDVERARDLGARLAGSGHAFIDAPVSGGAEAAAAGGLSFMLGGAEADVARAAPWLEILGARVSHFGAVGAGQAAKACHNMICGITALGVCEAFALADALGLDLSRFYELCRGAAAQSWILENRCPVPGPAPAAPAANDYAPGFAARLMAKDLGLAQQAARASGQSTEFGARAAERFREFVAGGGGDLDFSAIYRSIRE